MTAASLGAGCPILQHFPGWSGDCWSWSQIRGPRQSLERVQQGSQRFFASEIFLESLFCHGPKYCGPIPKSILPNHAAAGAANRWALSCPRECWWDWCEHRLAHNRSRRWWCGKGETMLLRSRCAKGEDAEKEGWCSYQISLLSFGNSLKIKFCKQHSRWYRCLTSHLTRWGPFLHSEPGSTWQRSGTVPISRFAGVSSALAYLYGFPTIEVRVSFQASIPSFMEIIIAFFSTLGALWRFSLGA